MASKSRQKSAGKKRKPNQLGELGLFDIPDLNAIDKSDDDSEIDESTLESELEALLSGKTPSKSTRPKPKVAHTIDIESLAADCMKDIDDDDEDDANLSTDEDLLNELRTLSTDICENVEPEGGMPDTEKSIDCPSAVTAGSVISILAERLKLYNEALAASRAINDTSKVRRYGRAVKTIEGLLKSAKSGGSINEEDIPPVVKIPNTSPSVAPVKSIDAPPTKPASVNIISTAIIDDHASVSTETLSTLQQLTIRRDQYKMAALQAKKVGDKDTALNYLRTVKNFTAVIDAVNNDQPVDLSKIPPPPSGFPELATITPSNATQKVVHDDIQTSSTIEQAALAAASEPEQPETFDAPPPPATILEALQQRLEKYSITKQAAEAEGNNGKVRRLQRIIKHYQTAIKDHKSGKEVDFNELPCPPGFAPIPVPGKQTDINPPPVEMKRTINDKLTPSSDSSKGKIAENSTATHSIPCEKKAKIQRTNTSTVCEKQREFLLERQKLFKQAALAAKKNGDIQLAKQYLASAKGFTSMIQATECGLPIDTSAIPTPPQLESDFVIVDASECSPNTDQSREELFETLEKDLTQQIEICIKNKNHFLRLGDVSSASKFEKLGLESKKDLSVIQHLKNKGDSVPLFHYETRLFSIVQCHTDLSDSDLILRVERGINLPGGPGLDSYIRVEFPIPSEAPQHAKTHTIRDTNNPLFEQEFKFEFNRKSRSQLRQFKRNAMKLEVWSKGGFLRSDNLLGVVHIKLVDLESKCSIHDSFNLLDGRKKPCGGMLEVKMRLRDPLLVKQVEEVKEKWLVIGI